METAEDRDRRLQAINDLKLLDRAGDPILDSLTRMASYVTGGSSAAVHILDGNYQHRIAGFGAPLVAHPEQDSMCREVLRDGQAIITADATLERRFAYSSFVQDPESPVRFYAAVPLRVGGGSVVGTVCAFDTAPRQITAQQVQLLEEIAELARAHLELVRVAAELGAAAVTDGLTGAVNRVMFNDRLSRALVRRDRHGTDVLVAMLDLDDFKQLNDTRGHEHGDAALSWVVERVQGAIRAEDTIGRLGGDEFAVVAEVSPGAGDWVAGRIQHALRGFNPPVTVSVGTVIAQPDEDARSVLRRADAAMYAVKRTGR